MKGRQDKKKLKLAAQSFNKDGAKSFKLLQVRIRIALASPKLVIYLLYGLSRSCMCCRTR